MGVGSSAPFEPVLFYSTMTYSLYLDFYLRDLRLLLLLTWNICQERFVEVMNAMLIIGMAGKPDLCECCVDQGCILTYPWMHYNS